MASEGPRPKKVKVEVDDDDGYGQAATVSDSTHRSSASSSVSDTESASSKPWKSFRQSFLDAAIKPHVSQWVATHKEPSEGGRIHDKDVSCIFGLKVRNLNEREFDGILTARSKMYGTNGCRLQKYQRFVETLNSTWMPLDLPIFYESGKEDPFDDWPEAVTKTNPKLCEDVLDALNVSYKKVEDFGRILDLPGARDIPSLAESLTFRSLVANAAAFHREVGAFIKIHGSSREGATWNLFNAFCSMADVRTHYGAAMPRTEKILNVKEVSSKPGLRIINVVDECAELFPEPGKEPVITPELKTTAVIQVKKLKPAGCSSGHNVEVEGTSMLEDNGRVLGQLFGELLLELPHTKARMEDEIFGILVRSTKVVFVQMLMSRAMLTEVTGREGSPSGKDYGHPEMNFSPVYDMLKREDRSKILINLYRLNWMQF